MFILIFMCQIKLINFVMFLLHVKYLIWIILFQPAVRGLVLIMSHLNSELRRNEFETKWDGHLKGKWPRPSSWPVSVLLQPEKLKIWTAQISLVHEYIFRCYWRLGIQKIWRIDNESDHSHGKTFNYSNNHFRIQSNFNKNNH